MFLIVIGVLIIISIVWAFISYKQLKNIKEVGEVKKDLQQNRVIFHSDSLPSDAP